MTINVSKQLSRPHFSIVRFAGSEGDNPHTQTTQGLVSTPADSFQAQPLSLTQNVKKKVHSAADKTHSFSQIFRDIIFGVGVLLAPSFLFTNTYHKEWKEDQAKVQKLEANPKPSKSTESLLKKAKNELFVHQFLAESTLVLSILDILAMGSLGAIALTKFLKRRGKLYVSRIYNEEEKSLEKDIQLEGARLLRLREKFLEKHPEIKPFLTVLSVSPGDSGNEEERANKLVALFQAKVYCQLVPKEDDSNSISGEKYLKMVLEAINQAIQEKAFLPEVGLLEIIAKEEIEGYHLKPVESFRPLIERISQHFPVSDADLLALQQGLKTVENHIVFEGYALAKALNEETPITISLEQLDQEMKTNQEKQDLKRAEFQSHQEKFQKMSSENPRDLEELSKQQKLVLQAQMDFIKLQMVAVPFAAKRQKMEEQRAPLSLLVQERLARLKQVEAEKEALEALMGEIKSIASLKSNLEALGPQIVQSESHGLQQLLEKEQRNPVLENGEKELESLLAAQK
ncbi:MAG: hypothetical protein K2X66_10315 [Cyanobacteria bacterium]|nr:hypothetical protein [Cyanobacteriota bacterium]